jgi:hypothetical protein
MPVDETAVQRLLDEREIRAVTMQYVRGCDRLDLDLVRACFHADGIVDFGFYVGGIDGLVADLEQRLRADLATNDLICNQEIDFASDDVAYVETTRVARHRQQPVDEEPERDFFGFGIWSDRFEKRDDLWRIAQRRLLFGKGRVDAVALDPILPPGFSVIPRGDDAFSGIIRPGDTAAPV